MSKEIEKHQKIKDLVIPAHAKKITTVKHLGVRTINGFLLAGLNGVPLAAFAISDVFRPEVTGIAAVMSLLLAFTAPNEEPSLPNANSFKGNFINQLSKIPLLHLFANGISEATSDGKKYLLETKQGKLTVYETTEPNPKELWDKMYESATGKPLASDLAMLKAYNY